MNDINATLIQGATPELETPTVSSTDDLLEKLRRRAEATKAIRFRAHVRLTRRHKLSAYVIAMLSIYVIGISLIPTIYELSARQNQALLACTIVLSTFIVVLVLSEGYESFYHQAHVMHGSAREIHGITFTLDFVDRRSQDFRETVQKLTQKYESLLQSCELNHAECDYHWVLSRHPDLFYPPNRKDKRTSSNSVSRLLLKSSRWCHATIGEFIWLAMPASFSVIATFVIYEIVNGWLK